MSAEIPLQDVTLGDLEEIVGQTSSMAKDLMKGHYTAKMLQRQSYYRSRLYTSQLGINPLIAAAHPIFSLIERINMGDTPPHLARLEENLLHELKAFSTRTHTEEYNNETIVLAQYLLGATIEEAIKKSLLKHNEVSTQLQLFSHYHQEEQGPEQRFFQILDRILAKPDTYLDLIELLYLCLRSGFEGKFYNQPNSKKQLDDILENVYQVIKHYRTDTHEILFITTTQPQITLTKKAFPWKTLLVALCLTITLSYILSNYLLNYQANNLITQLAELTQHNQHYNY